MSVSVSRIGQSFDRSANRLVDQSISHDSLVSLLISHSVSVSVPVHTCAHHPFAPLARSGFPLCSPGRTTTYTIYTCILPHTHDASCYFSLPLPTFLHDRARREEPENNNTSSNESIHFTRAPFSTYGGRHAWSVTTFNP